MTKRKEIEPIDENQDILINNSNFDPTVISLGLKYNLIKKKSFCVILCY